MSSGGIAERRLRPLWDAIDSRQYKAALKLASALQSKHPDAPYVLVLKALVLERLGKPDEALALCRQAKDMQPVDDLILNTMQIVYQRLGYLDEATVSYENACSRSPGNLELLMALFNCYVRQYNYVKQQQTAMKMYKIAGEEKYLMWAVCSIYLQVRPINAEGKKLLTLAEALLKKRIESNGINNLEALRIYVSLLQDQEKYETALDVLSGQLGALFTIRLDRLRLQGDLQMRLCQYSHATATYKEILNISSDDWAAVIHLLNASLGLSETGSSDEATAGRISSLHISFQEKYDRLEELSNTMRGLQPVDTQDLRRAPLLAIVEIGYRCLLYKRGDGDGDHSMVLAASILEYFKRFGHLASFLSDVKGYLLALNKGSKEWLVNQLREECFGLAHPVNPTKCLRRKVAVYQVEEHLGHREAVSDRASDIQIVEILNLYKDSLQYSRDLDPQDSMPGEELLVIATNLLIKLFLHSNELGLLLEAICVLEYGLSLRRFNFQYKVMLINLYTTLSATALAINWFKSLDIKNILLEVASHHILPTLLASPNWPELEAALKDSVKFHEDYQNEAADMTILAYRHCNYSKVLEFVELKEKLKNSHHYLLVRVELILLSMKQKVERLDEVEAILVKLECGKELLKWSAENNIASLSFNEDFESRPWWSPLPDKNFLIGSSMGVEKESDVEEQFLGRQERWRASIMRRCLVPRLLFLAFRAVSSEKDGREGSSVPVEFKQLLERYLKGFNLSLNSTEQFLSETVSSRISLQMQGIEMDANTVFTISVFWFARQLSSWSLSSECGVDKITNALVLLGKLFKAPIKGLTDSFTSAGAEGTIALGTSLSSLSMLISESLGWLALCIQAWVRRLQPMTRKKKKPSEVAEDKNVIKLVDGLRNLVACICSELETLNMWLARRTDRPEEEEVQELMSLIGTGSVSSTNSAGRVLELVEAPDVECVGDWKAGDLLKRIVNSQRSTLLGLRELSMARLKFLKSFKL